jgi:hypothetical protein
MAGRGKGANRGGWEDPGLTQAFLAGDGGDLLRDGTGAAWGQPGLPRPAGACRARDMMIDQVSSRLRGDAAAQSIQAVRLALRGRTGSG